jgi:hypothetical protein
MQNGEEKAKRWWLPRFSLRSLASVITLVCAYFAAWSATERFAASLDQAGYCAAYSPVPCILVRFETIQQSAGRRPLFARQYYLWLFGPTIKLPYTTDW